MNRDVCFRILLLSKGQFKLLFGLHRVSDSNFDLFMSSRRIVSFFAFALALSVHAQTGNWYAGVQAGMPFGVSTFSSFGADKTRFGWEAGIYGGFRFNPIFSLEASLAWGKTSLSAQECCHYWLGADGMPYYAPVLGMEGWDYGNLKSETNLQRYGMQLNMNVLGFFERTKQSRWTFEVSPLLAVVGSKACVNTVSGNVEVLPSKMDWHFGAGGNLQLGFRITESLGVNLYSGITYLTGKRMDGMPEFRHRNNFLWESGLKIGWTFGRKSKERAVADRRDETVTLIGNTQKVQSCTDLPPMKEKIETPVLQDSEKGQEAVRDEKAALKKNEIKNSSENVVEPDTVPVAARADLHFPVVYFSFNSVWIEPKEKGKIEEIADILHANPAVRIIVTGWCDTIGSYHANQRVSLQRAKAVKRCLEKSGIAPERVEIAGGGSVSTNPPACSRRATVICIEKEEQR